MFQIIMSVSNPVGLSDVRPLDDQQRTYPIIGGPMDGQLTHLTTPRIEGWSKNKGGDFTYLKAMATHSRREVYLHSGMSLEDAMRRLAQIEGSAA